MEIERDRMKQVGNTKQPLQLKHHFFTLNNYSIRDIEMLETTFKFLDAKYVFQEENGEKGTPHLQGCISLKKKLRWTEFKLNPKIHWEKTRNIGDAIEYCRKLDTRNGTIYTNIKMPNVIKYLPEEDLYEWQKEVVDIIRTEPDPRHIHWYVDEVGNKGKSELCRFLCLKENAILLSGKIGDMKHGILKYHKKHKIYPETILIDSTRRTFDSHFLSEIEEIKNGAFFSTKYKGGQVLMNRPHIIIFSNTEPDVSRLIEDRWKIKRI